MSSNNRVIWSEGLFLQPQHFQQQDRYFERYVDTRCQPLASYSWGFTDIEINRDLLSIGKFSLRRAAGIFPDGTPFRMKEDEPLPEPLDVDPQVRDQVVYLAVPLRGAGDLETVRDSARDELARYAVREWQARDAGAAGGDAATLDVAALRTRLLLASQVTPAYACLPLAHIVECRADKLVSLNDTFIPTVMHTRAATRLATFASELSGLLHQRGEALKDTVVATDRLGTAGFVAFLWLLTVNRYEPLFKHAIEVGALHPEQLYQLCVSAAGEFATFTPAKRPPTFPGYQHDRLRESFEPVIESLRVSLSEIVPVLAIQIPLRLTQYGVRVAITNDRSLFTTATFILAAKANVPDGDLRRDFPAQVKIGAPERISDLVNLGLPAVPIRPLSVAPAQIPFHFGYTYFELDQNNTNWEPVKTSGAMALHVPDSFPGLTMEFWAIRSSV